MHVINRSRAVLPLMSALALLCPAPALALGSDLPIPIHIEADRAEINESEGASVYSGNVSVSQGTIRITADQIRIVTQNDAIIEIIASTAANSQHLAHYEQKPEPERDPVYADARQITYRVREEALELSGQARLQQTTDTFSGELLRYDVKQGTVSLAGSTGDDPENPGRISISLTPPKK